LAHFGAVQRASTHKLAQKGAAPDESVLVGIKASQNHERFRIESSISLYGRVGRSPVAVEDESGAPDISFDDLDCAA
jgi:hypothetical protein